ncbi:MAG: GntR family transcriptional regulator [Planctomycetota bacterium]|nr:GntR family transcriptional regulator [Planctomycetota bacterium]
MARTDDTADLRVGSQAYKAYKRVVRYLHIHQLKEGDRLPTQQEFCKLLNTNNDTLNGAMHALVKAGVLRRKSKVGTTVAELGKLGPVVWSVGLAALPAAFQGPNSYNAVLAYGVQSELTRLGCRVQCYYRYKQEVPAKLSSFPGLEDDLEHGELDGLVVLARAKPGVWKDLARLEVAGHEFTGDPTAPCGTSIDNVPAVVDAVSILVREGCRRVAVVHKRPRNDPPAGMKDGVGAVLSEAGLKPEAVEWIFAPPGMDSGRKLGLEFLERAPSARPDGMLVIDDYSCLGVTQELHPHASYRPRLAAMTNRQLPLGFALPVIRFELDIDELVRRASALFLKQLYNPTLTGQFEWVVPKRADAQTPLASPIPE